MITISKSERSTFEDAGLQEIIVVVILLPILVVPLALIAMIAQGLFLIPFSAEAAEVWRKKHKGPLEVFFESLLD